MSISLLPVEGIGEIHPGDDLAGIIAEHAELAAGDVVVVTQKVVSKAEGRLVAIDPDDPTSHKAIVADEAVRVLRRRRATVSSVPTRVSTSPTSSAATPYSSPSTPTAAPDGSVTACSAAPGCESA
jgi:F420-0:gamma-glutamyl ligase